MIASQCHPSAFDQTPKDQTYIWHTSDPALHDTLSAQYETWWGVPGGSTVMLRAIPLMRMLGFKRMHLFGFDSCISENDHHAYAQPENDGAPIIDVLVGGKAFRCHPWMVSQAQEFMDTVKYLGNEVELGVYGDGLIAWIMEVGASVAEKDLPDRKFEFS
jgi:hypothetical protein